MTASSTPRWRSGSASASTARIEFVVSDRRLLVKNTCLAELRDGSAAALAAALRDLDQQLDTEQSAREDAASRRDLQEHERAEAVARGAAQIRFE